MCGTAASTHTHNEYVPLCQRDVLSSEKPLLCNITAHMMISCTFDTDDCCREGDRKLLNEGCGTVQLLQGTGDVDYSAGDLMRLLQAGSDNTDHL